jgi:carbon storage regulator CsrA
VKRGGGLRLTRKVGERVVIGIGDGDVVDVTVEEIRGSRVALRFAAPEDVTIHRSELLEREAS